MVSNVAKQRLCEKEVGQRYGRWKVSANSTNLGSKRLAGVALLRSLELLGWRYHDGCDGLPPTSGQQLAEVYPYTALVGARNWIRRRAPRLQAAAESIPVNSTDFRVLRAANCDDLVRRLTGLEMPIRRSI